MQYLRAVVSKAKAMQEIAASSRDRDIFSQTVNLSDLLRPDTFLNALRQQTARESKVPMDTLVLNTSWSGEVKHGKNVSIKITGLQLEGCSFDGGRLSESAPDAPSVLAFPPCSIAWIPRVGGCWIEAKRLCLSPFPRMSLNRKHVKPFHCQSTSAPLATEWSPDFKCRAATTRTNGFNAARRSFSEVFNFKSARGKSRTLISISPYARLCACTRLYAYVNALINKREYTRKKSHYARRV